jgi:predicted molibdopterin-dependent oxidoreductase YjgC
MSEKRSTANVTLVVDGEPVQARAGQSVAAALLASGRRVLRSSPRLRRPRGIFCAMGVCQECVVIIDGRLRTSCTTLVRAGMQIATGRTDP